LLHRTNVNFLDQFLRKSKFTISFLPFALLQLVHFEELTPLILFKAIFASKDGQVGVRNWCPRIGAGWGKKVGAQFLFYLELKESVKHVTLASLYIYIYFAEEPFLKWIIFLTSGFDRIWPWKWCQCFEHHWHKGALLIWTLTTICFDSFCLICFVNQSYFYVLNCSKVQ